VYSGKQYVSCLEISNVSFAICEIQSRILDTSKGRQKRNENIKFSHRKSGFYFQLERAHGFAIHLYVDKMERGGSASVSMDVIPSTLTVLTEQLRVHLIDGVFRNDPSSSEHNPLISQK
jgi:hypothetical protein